MTYALRYRWWLVLIGVGTAAFDDRTGQRSRLAGVWVGTTVGMVIADGLAIAAGVLLHRRLPERLLHASASLLFLLFGLWMLFDDALGWRWMAVIAMACIGLVAATMTTVRFMRRPQASAPIPAAAGRVG